MPDMWLSCYQSASALTVANLANWNTISSVNTWAPHNGDQINACEHLAFAQDFMVNNKGLTTINTTRFNYYQSGLRDTTFKLTRLKSDWITYFTQLQDIEINDENWDREDLSGLTHLTTFMLLAGNQNHSNDPTNNPVLSLPPVVIDNVLIQIAAGGARYNLNGSVSIGTGSTNRKGGKVACGKRYRLCRDLKDR